jgi:stress-induced morphogen
MDPSEIERLVEESIPDAEATLSRPRSPDRDHEDAHFAAVVVSPAFEGKSLVQQHQMVYDALDDHMTTDIHALEIKTYTPEEYAEYTDSDAT